jgi:putative autotransporter adhesin-like protein
MRNSQRAILGLLGVIVALMVVIAVWVRATAPDPLELSGERTTRTYDYTDFDGVDVNGQWQVTIERGDAWRVSVEVPAEVIGRVSVERIGNELVLQSPWWLGDFDRAGGAVRANITMPALEALDLSGSTRLSFSGFDGSALSVDTSGGVEVRGAASRFDTLTLDLSGAGNINLADVPVTDADVDISGAASVTLRMAGGRLTGDLSGAANLEYFGTVSEESIDKSGFVNVRKRN